MDITEFSAGWRGAIPIPQLEGMLYSLNEFDTCWTEVHMCEWVEAVREEVDSEFDSGNECGYYGVPIGDGEWEIPIQNWREYANSKDITLRNGVVVGMRRASQNDRARWNVASIPDHMMPGS